MEYSWSKYEESDDVAIAGGMTTAYKCRVQEHRLTVETTTYPKSECANVEAALEILARGESCIVASADIPALRIRLLVLGIG